MQNDESAPRRLRLLRVSHRLSHVLAEELRDSNLSLAQFDVLAHIGAAAGISQQALADGLFVTKGNVCQILDRMEASGLIMRRKAGRTNQLFLTETGRSLYNQVVPSHEARIVDQFAALPDGEVRHLHNLLRRLDQALP